MPHNKRVSFSQRAIDVREIAKGIFDQKERRIVLQFVDDAERLAQAAPPTAVLTALGDIGLEN